MLIRISFTSDVLQSCHSLRHNLLLLLMKPYTSLLGYCTFSVGINSSLMDLTLTNLLSKFALPALSFVPLALDPVCLD